MSASPAQTFEIEEFQMSEDGLEAELPGQDIDLKQEMRREIQSVEMELKNLYVKTSGSAIQTRSSTEWRKKYNEISSYLKMLKESLATYFMEVGSPQKVVGTEKQSTTKEESKSNILKHLPTFRNGNANSVEDAILFLKQFERILAGFETPRTNYASFLSLVVHLNESEWAEEMKRSGKDWNEIKKLFIERFTLPTQRERNSVRLTEFKMKPYDKLQTHLDKFTTLASQSNLEGKELLSIFLSSLLPQIRERIFDYQDLQHTMSNGSKPKMDYEECLAYVKNYNYIPVKNDYNNPNMMKPMICHHCGKTGHKKEQCRKRKKEETNPVSGSMGPKVLKCSNCGRAGHLKEQCYSKTKAVGAKKSKINIELSSDNESIKSNSNYFCCCSAAAISDHRPDEMCVSLKVQFASTSIKTIAFIDCGADRCFISKKLVNDYNIPLEALKTNLDLILADGTATSSGPVTHKTIPLQVKLDAHVETKSFLVADVTYDVVLSMSWLQRHKIEIDFGKHELKFNSEYCLSKCIERPIIVKALTKEEMPSATIPTKKTTVEIKKTKTRARHFIKNIKEENHQYGSFFIKRDGRNGKYRVFNANVPTAAIFDMSTKEPKKKLHPTAERLKQEFADVFSEEKAADLPEHRQFDCDVPLIPGAVIPHGRVYQLSEPERKTLEEYVNAELAKGSIRYSQSPAGAPCFFVKKKDGSLRLCVDFRGLNKLTIKNRYPLPLIPELIRMVASGKIYTALDLRGAYNLVRIKKGDEWKTAFRTPFGHFEYLVMPFGLTNAPAIFQSMMDKIFRDLIGVSVVVYLDDILIYSQNEVDHERHVREVLLRLQQHKLYCKLSKCDFFTTSIPYLGHIITPNGVSMDPSKVKCVQDWPVPTSVVEIQSFLGLANYYRAFIPNFAEKAVHMTKLTRKDVPFVWGPDQQKAFNELKLEFTEGRILAHPDTSKSFVLETDASDVALGGVLSQYHGDDLRPVAFYAKQHSPAERNYEIYDKELLAIVECCKHWRHFLQGSLHTTTIITDHENLKYFKEAHRLTRRQARWSLFLSEFDFVINHRPGKLHKAADAISRRVDFITDDIQNDNTNHNLAVLFKTMHTTLNATRTTDELDFLKRVRLATSSEFIEGYNGKDGFYVQDGILYRNGLVCIPTDELRLEVLKIRHDSPTAGHFGTAKTFDLVNRDFYWPGMRDFVAKYVKSCDCARYKAARNQPYGPLQPIPVGDLPWKTIACDFIVQLPRSEGYDAIAVWVCRTTKMAHFLPCTTELSAKDNAKMFIDNIVKLHGLPDQIISDRGPQFTSQFWQACCKRLKSESALSTAFHPQTDGQTERVNQTLEQYLRTFSDYYQTNWKSNLALAEFAYNNMTNASTKFSPFFANYGFHPRADALIQRNPEFKNDYLDAISDNFIVLHDNIKNAQKKMVTFADAHRSEVPFKVGDKVWLSTRNLQTRRPSKKLDYKRIGPYTISKQINAVAFELSLPPELRIHNVFHCSLLSPYVENEFENRVASPPTPVEVDGEFEFEVEEVIQARKGISGFPTFKVLWKGYPRDDATWEPLINLENSLDKVEYFYRRHPKAYGRSKFDAFAQSKRGGNVTNI